MRTGRASASQKGRSQEETDMCLDDTLHPGRPATAELVPSRYALRVGEIDVLVISDGVLPFKTPELASNAAPAGRAAWLDDMFLPPDVMVWPLCVAAAGPSSSTLGSGWSTRTSRGPGGRPCDWRPPASISQPSPTWCSPTCTSTTLAGCSST